MPEDHLNLLDRRSPGDQRAGVEVPGRVSTGLDLGCIRRDKAQVDKAAQERGAPRVAPYLLHRVHPETGLDVVFIPGELLPEWVEVGADA